ncbi:hypothetical protein B0H14DRAFT_2503385 [Mycena olivaceomarginata]|nr:hypothetical protein B0H14DRAFT_2503385 [Mycena olivaceomarginata]
MAPAAPQGLTVSTLISAKGTQLKFWIVQTNEKAAKKVINVTGTVDQLRANLAAYYGFDLTVNPREDVMPAPTVDESIRDRQWADLEALGIEWKATVDAGGVFKLLESPNKSRANTISDLLLSATQPHRADHQQPMKLDSHPTVSTHNCDLESINFVFSAFSACVCQIPSSDPSATRTIGAYSNHSTNSGQSDTANVSHIISVANNPHSHPRTESSVVATHQSNPGAAAPAPHEAALIQDLSKVIEGLEKCEGLQDIVHQIESGAIKAIRIRYGPVDERRGTADPSWPKYKNLVSKRERLYKVLERDFEGNKERFFAFFSLPKKRKRDDEDPTLSEDRFQSYRKIVEAKPWCEADLEAERQKEQYHNSNGEFAEGKWTARWGAKNSWEVWREMKRERYVKEKKSG